MDPYGPPGPRKGAEEEVLDPEAADFWHPGTIVTAEGHRFLAHLDEIAEEEFLVRCQMGVCHRASRSVSPLQPLICILIYCINLESEMDQYPSEKSSAN